MKSVLPPALSDALYLPQSPKYMTYLQHQPFEAENDTQWAFPSISIKQTWSHYVW